MLHSQVSLASFVKIAAGLSSVQRRFLAAMAEGAQVLQTTSSGAYQAWSEQGDAGRVAQVQGGLAKTDMIAMKLLLPMIEKGFNETWGYEFYFLPGQVRASVKEVLTLSMPAPEPIRMQVEWRLQQAERTASLDSSDDGQSAPPRMAMA